MINEALAKQFLRGNGPDRDKRVMLGVPDNLMRDDLIPGIKRFEWLTIVGVVGNVKKFALGDTPTPEAYIPYRAVATARDLPLVDVHRRRERQRSRWRLPARCGTRSGRSIAISRSRR